MSKKISVLGTGWLGLPLSAFLLDQGIAVKGSTRSSARCELLQAAGITPFIVDLAKAILPDADFLDSEILIVNIPFKDQRAFADLVQQIAQSPIKQVIFISSTSVYGPHHRPITEADTHCLVPCPLLAIEQLFTRNTHFSTTVVRFAGLIGYSRNPALFFKNNRVVQHPDSTVNMIHRDDCINIIDAIIKRQAWGEIYNACADTHPTKRAFYTYAATLTEVAVPQFSDQRDSECKIIANHKVKKELAYDFIYPDLLNFKLSS